MENRGVGKTECAKFLTAFIPPEQKVIIVEDTKEVHYREINPEKDCVELKVNEYFSYNDAMTEVLRMTPNRVMLSEARSTEVKQLVECWTTGITGFTTLHTDDVRKIPDRILNMMPSRQDAERLENDVYVGMDVGVLLETRSSGEEGKQERYISQIGFFLQRRWKKSVYASGAGRTTHRATGVGVFTGGHKEKKWIKQGLQMYFTVNSRKKC